MKPEDNDDNNMNNESNQLIRLKQFCVEVGTSLSLKPDTFYYRMVRGHMPWPRLKRINQRVVLVKTSVEAYLKKLS